MKLFKNVIYCKACKGKDGNRSQILMAETNNEYDPTPIIKYKCTCGKTYEHRRLQEFLAQAKKAHETIRIYE